ncbi:MAG: twin-arginine translocation signal domain-containing protein [Planctomycetota bacterium]|jgi:hypothetical protein
MKKRTSISRRDFVQTALGASVALSAPGIIGVARGQGRIFKVGLIGCGGRGRGAAVGALEAGKILGLRPPITSASGRCGRANN